MFQLLLLLLLLSLVLSYNHNAFSISGSLATDQEIKVTDFDNSTFTITRASPNMHPIASCYIIRKGSEHKEFCYPAVNVVGVRKCGTSALYVFLTENDKLMPATKRKEHCPRADTLPIYRYLSQFVVPDREKLTVNGCINVDIFPAYAQIERALAPNTVSILTVRSLPDQMWAAYNFWCTPALDGCNGQLPRSTRRSPELFDELLRSPNCTLNLFRHGCSDMKFYFLTAYRNLVASLKEPPFVLSMEGLASSTLRDPTSMRLAKFINSKLSCNVDFSGQSLKQVNTGNNHGPHAVSNSSTEGMYSVSGYRPLLNQTRELIMKRWDECLEVSKLSQQHYDCYH